MNGLVDAAIDRMDARISAQRRRALVLLATLTCATPAEAHPPTANDPAIGHARRAVAHITSGPSSGSAFAIEHVRGRPIRWLTAGHVVRDRAFAIVRLHDGSVWPAAVVRVDHRRDLALLQSILPAITDGASLLLSDREPSLAEKVTVIGHPGGLAWTVTTGGVANVLRGAANRVAAVFVTAIAAPGSSGGPIVNRAGRVVGVITGLIGRFTLGPALCEVIAFLR